MVYVLADGGATNAGTEATAHLESGVVLLRVRVKRILCVGRVVAIVGARVDPLGHFEQRIHGLSFFQLPSYFYN